MVFVALLFCRAGTSSAGVPLDETLDSCWVLIEESWHSGGRGMEMIGAGLRCLVSELGCEVLPQLAPCSGTSAETALGFLAGKSSWSEGKNIYTEVKNRKKCAQWIVGVLKEFFRFWTTNFPHFIYIYKKDTKTIYCDILRFPWLCKPWNNL